ncbi:amino acid/amide ABC transporter ATP-binding protein 2 (HAAT family) [Humitalea rosea]|uniref:Amino acid/amide ABC transporter ATP-binding protein 2 (HAAT family) n=1 Tax=Humitalea rosea TaxID=990373 RepID=A0A2W7HUF1_9PROT|nr:ABC transporter ATP-binding protein [Humitalea rosea]PZW37837.1 amino acid/amide ABC transporter ATP-binding protein 2 (HAAT family) [Humitalea rosea]
MLEVEGLSVSYGAVQALTDVSLSAAAGSTTAVLGANGAGKSSLLRAISGIAPIGAGCIRLDGQDVTRLSPQARARHGLAHAMEGRRLFRQMNVEENLRLAWSFGARSTPWAAALEDVYARFPILAQKSRIASGLLSGGQQQMVILSCTTIRSPRVLLLDEPSLGLAPLIVRQIYAFIAGFARDSGATVVIAEQMASIALQVADRGCALRRGRVALTGTATELLRGGLAATYL